MASPMVAGVAALILEAHPNISAEDVKTILLQTARQDNNTGVLPSGGDPKWGHGKVNALAAVLEAVSLNSVEDMTPAEEIHIYPNPVVNELHIDPAYADFHNLLIHNLSGSTFELDIENGTLFCQSLPSGIYFISFDSLGKHHVVPFIKN